MPTKAFGTWVFDLNAYRITGLALSLAGTTQYAQLDVGLSGFSSDDVYAAYLTAIEKRIHFENPRLSVAEEEVIVPAGTRFFETNNTTLPDLYGQEILRVSIAGNDETIAKQIIPIRSEKDGRDRSGYEQNILERRIPWFCYTDRIRSILTFDSQASQEMTYAVAYRFNPTRYTAADLAEGSTKYSSIPTCFEFMIALRVAMLLIKTLPNELRQAKMAELQSEYQEHKDMFEAELATTPLGQVEYQQMIGPNGPNERSEPHQYDYGAFQ